MEALSNLLENAIIKIKAYDKDCFNEYKIKLYELANGKTLTKDMAEYWVNSMVPKAKWDFNTTSLVRRQYNVGDIDEISFYVVMNMLYSDMHNILGEGDNEEDVRKYIQATRDWLKDEDIAENKLYNYWRYVAQH